VPSAGRALIESDRIQCQYTSWEGVGGIDVVSLDTDMLVVSIVQVRAGMREDLCEGNMVQNEGQRKPSLKER